MFSGIISEIGQVLEAVSSETGMAIKIGATEAFGHELSLGCSISVNGVCLTLTAFQNSTNSVVLSFDVIRESLNRSNLKELKTGTSVNLERSLKFGDEIGGHLCSGHVDCEIAVQAVSQIGESKEIDFIVPEKFNKYIFEKGFIAINGASITVSKKIENGFRVALIPETLNRTNLNLLAVADSVNLEVDRQTQVIVESVEQYLARTA